MLKNGLYNVSGAVLRMLLSVLTIPLLIRLIGVEEYGLWTLVTAVISAVTLGEAGWSMSTTVFVARDLAVGDEDGILQTLTVTLGSMVVLTILATLALWLSAATVVPFFPNLSQAQQQVAAQAFQFGGLVIWPRLLQQVAIGLEQAYQRYGVMNFLNTLQAALISLGLILIAWQGGRVMAMLQWQSLISSIILACHLYVVWRLMRQLKLRPVWNRARAREVMAYGGMTWLVALGNILFGQVDRITVGAFLGTAALGIYAAVTSIAVQVNILSALPVQPLIPDLVAVYKPMSAASASIAVKIKNATEINAVVALGLGASLFVLAPLVATFIGIDPTNSDLLRMAIIIYALYSLNAVGYFILFSIKAVEVNLIVGLLGSVFSILLVALGAHFIGLPGAIAGNAGYILTLTLNVVSCRKLEIPGRQWLTWVRFPLLWFALLIGISLSMATALPQRSNQLLVLGVALAGLGGWLVRVQGWNKKTL